MTPTDFKDIFYTNELYVQLSLWKFPFSLVLLFTFKAVIVCMAYLPSKMATLSIILTNFHTNIVIQYGYKHHQFHGQSLWCENRRYCCLHNDVTQWLIDITSTICGKYGLYLWADGSYIRFTGSVYKNIFVNILNHKHQS